MFSVARDGNRFMIKSELYDVHSETSHTSYVSFLWQDANDIQSKLSQLLLDFEIERGAFPVADDEDYVAEIHRIGEAF